MPDQEWREDALCRQVGPEIFYPEPGEGCNIARYAKRICLACPVRAACLNEAIQNHEQYGIWGGLTERERLLLNRGEPVPVRRELMPHGTVAAFRRHIRNGQKPCKGCRRAWNDNQTRRYAAKREPAS